MAPVYCYPAFLFICFESLSKDLSNIAEYNKSVRTCFGGKLEVKSLNPFERGIVKKVKAPEGDFRDWQAIAAWTGTISEES